MDSENLLRKAVANHVSDLHLQTQCPPMMRINGRIRAVDLPPFDNEQIAGFIATMVPKIDRDTLTTALVEGLDFSYSADGIGRFRCSAYRQQGRMGIVMRVIKTQIPSLSELNLPDVIKDVALAQRGANAPQTIERIITMFPPAEHKLLLAQLGGSIEAIISQRLITTYDNARIPAVEILRGSGVTKKLIAEEKIEGNRSRQF